MRCESCDKYTERYAKAGPISWPGCESCYPDPTEVVGSSDYEVYGGADVQGLRSSTPISETASENSGSEDIKY